MLDGYSIRYVFTNAHALVLRKYLLRVSTLYIGLTLMEIQRLAQEYTIQPEHNIPMSWTQHEWEIKLFESSSTTIINKS